MKVLYYLMLYTYLSLHLYLTLYRTFLYISALQHTEQQRLLLGHFEIYFLLSKILSKTQVSTPY